MNAVAKIPGRSGAVGAKSRLEIWVRSGGRCQFEGCNCELLGEELSGRRGVNKALVAHIVAAAADGPRGDPVRSSLLVNDPENLMLLCHAHHRLVDDEHPTEYPEARLKAMKAAHEARIRIVTAIQPDRATQLLYYAAKVGQHDCLVTDALAFGAVLPDRYPKDGRAISLGLGETPISDVESAFWDYQVQHLRRQFAARVSERRGAGEVGHLSVFAVAPQPLLMELGRLLGDLGDVEVRQLSREPKGWAWRPGGPPMSLDVTPPPESQTGRRVALKLALSAEVTDVRIREVLGADAPIWSIAARRPHNDILHRADCLAAFRAQMRDVFNRIKARHGEDAEIHIFPAVPVAVAVEVGRVWMPKADLPLVIYDSVRGGGGFVARHGIGEKPPP